MSNKYCVKVSGDGIEDDFVSGELYAIPFIGSLQEATELKAKMDRRFPHYTYTIAPDTEAAELLAEIKAVFDREALK